MTAPTPLVGRDDLLARAVALLEGTAGPAGGVVLVGEGGVGKSRLAAEIARLGADRGYLAVSTVGTQAATAIPLGALSHLLPDLTSATGNVLAAARTALVERAGDRRLLLSVDDAHLLDDHSAALVLQLSMSMPAFVVATVRTGEPVPDPVLALWKEGFAEMAANDPGAVVTVEVKRSAGIYENRKPWNKGTFKTGKPWWVARRYFVRGGSCADWPKGKAGLFETVGGGSRAWPADNLPAFLNLQVLVPASPERAAFL